MNDSTPPCFTPFVTGQIKYYLTLHAMIDEHVSEAITLKQLAINHVLNSVTNNLQQSTLPKDLLASINNACILDFY